MSFLASIYLWFIPLISIPLIFHLLKRRQYKTIYFSSLKFFLDNDKKTLNKVNIINIILLLIRMLIILLLIIIFSNPVIEGLLRKNTLDESTIVKIYIDNSYSNINFINNNINNTLKNILKIYPEKTHINIKTSNDINIFDNLIENINLPLNIPITYESFNLSNIYKIANNDISKKYLNKDMFIISDFQKNVFDNYNIKSYNDILNEWNIFLIKNSTQKEYIALHNLEISNQNIATNQLFDINIKCYNMNDIEIENKTIELYIEDIKVGENTVNLNPNKSHIYNFKTSIPNSGLHKCYISIGTNKYHFIINIKENINAGLIYDNYSDAKYIYNFLNTYSDLNTKISINKIEENIYNYNNDEYDIIFKFGTKGISNQLFNNLSKHTNTLVVVPTNTLNIDSYPIDPDTEILITNLGERYLSIDNMNIENSYLKDILNISNDIKIFNYFILPKSNNTIIKLTNNNALLNKYSQNNLDIYLFTIPMNLTSSNIPISSIFIPLLQYFLIDNNYNDNVVVGDEFHIDKVSSNDTIQYIINSNIDYYKSYNFFKNKIKINNPGFHTIIFDESNKLTFAANMSKNELTDYYIGDNNITDYFNNPTFIDNTDDIYSNISNKLSATFLWRYLIYLLTLLIMIEMYISNIYIYKND